MLSPITIDSFVLHCRYESLTQALAAKAEASGETASQKFEEVFRSFILIFRLFSSFAFSTFPMMCWTRL
jgi:hypothetical protein